MSISSISLQKDPSDDGAFCRLSIAFFICGVNYYNFR